MTPERLQQIEDLYHSALDRDSAERMAFINDSCNGDEELRHAGAIRVYEDPADLLDHLDEVGGRR